MACWYPLRSPVCLPSSAMICETRKPSGMVTFVCTREDGLSSRARASEAFMCRWTL